MAIGDVFKSIIEFESFTQLATVCFHLEQLDPDTDGVPAAACGIGVAAVLIPELRRFLSDTCAVTRVSTYAVTGNDRIPGLGFPVGQNGLRPGEPAPFNIALQFALFQNQNDAVHNGRVFIAGISEDDTTGNEYNVVDRSSAIDDFNNVLTANVPGSDSGGTINFRFVIWGKPQGSLPTAPPSVARPVTAAVARTRLKSQIRRSSRSRSPSILTEVPIP